ncbi:SPFH domain-containing protein [Pseudomonas japonica]|jgi:regulator of protease activity HflC (stomatin/prohibitin superfamily)|uniref:SPFH domain-containing protein n=1 Tax=Pseudomonas TaxID=286 RepID=UPI0028318CFD|nr:SPFH domain-containing protein [Pseudomonas sp. zfem002]MDR0279389.1 SPFH/Band 7/PHB domain protein [Paucimonas sp.]MDU9392577.1 SPFH domain-containing protein [Pseudomonas sp. zfem002]
MTSLIITATIALFVLVTVFKGVRIVPQGEEWIVERLGRYHTTLKPGLNILIPYMDVVAYRLPTKDIILDVQQQEIITRDNAVIVANALCFAKVVDPQKASYGVENYTYAVTSLTMTALRAIVGAMDLDEALSSREQIKARLREAMSEQTEDWGITVRSVEIQDIKPSPNMQAAMERQAAAERERKADVTRAEGAKQAAILEAQARQESAKLDAAAQVNLAEASAQAITLVKNAVGTDVTPAMYLLGERYINAMENLAGSDNAKMVVLPADLQEAVRGMLGRTKS